MVAMFVFLVFLTIILTSVIAITGASTRAQVVSRTASGVLVVFQNIDRQIRYADSVNFPGAGATTGSRYVEFRVPASSASSGVATCTQWRYWPATRSIQTRQWTEGSAPSANWATKMSNVLDPGGANYPFKLTPATIGGSATQQLQFTISSGTVSITTGASMSSTFVARNSSVTSPSNSSSVVAGVSDTPVCTSSGSRP
jgi:hypothetical protein